MVEVDETSVGYRTKDDPVAGGPGRSHDGKLLVAGAAIECKKDGRHGRIRLSVIHYFSAKSQKGFLATSTREGATILTDAFSSYQGMEGRKRLPKRVGVMATHVLPPWVHCVFANLKRLALGVYHGLRQRHLQAYLDEFVFRWNRRRHYRVAFDMLLGIGLRTGPMSYRALTNHAMRW
jgi:transposase-like protein